MTSISIESTSINISWVQNDTTVDYYEIQYNFTVKECNSIMKIFGPIKINNSTTEYTLSNSTNTPVEEDSVYSISLTAVNSVGQNETVVVRDIVTKGAGSYFLCTISNWIVVLYPSLAPSGAPQSIMMSSIDETSISIQWDNVECEQRNGEIEGYYVTYYPRESNTTGERFDITVFGTMESNRTFLASELQPRTNYTFEVKAFRSNEVGPSITTSFQTSLSNSKIF